MDLPADALTVETDRLLLERARLPGTDAPTDVLVDGGVIAAIGGPPPDGDVPVRCVDLEGRTVIPGLWDAHVHAEQWAVARRRLDLSDARSVEEVADLVAAAATTSAGGPREPLLGVGLRWALLRGQPHKDLLDTAAPGRIVALQSHDIHTAWLSPAALRRAGLPEHPTGVVQELACYQAMAALQEHDAATIDGWVADALSAAAARGVTGIIDFEFGDALPSWRRRAQRGPLAARVSATVYREHLPAAIERGWPTGTRVPGTGGLLEVGPLKLFVDGSLNSRTALCHDPYPGGDDRGSLETPPEELQDLMRRAAEHGISSAVHAIGDRANTVALDAFEAIGCGGRIEHAQLLVPDDVARFARLGVVAGVQPAHLLDDRDVAEQLWPGRTSRAYAFRDLLAAGARLEFGSDAPVAPLDPWLAITAAVTRSPDARGPWHPEQQLAVEEALAASSRGRRRLAAGDPADLVVLDRDPSHLDAADLTDPGVAATLCAGRWTHQAR